MRKSPEVPPTETPTTKLNKIIQINANKSMNKICEKLVQGELSGLRNPHKSMSFTFFIYCMKTSKLE